LPCDSAGALGGSPFLLDQVRAATASESAFIASRPFDRSMMATGIEPTRSSFGLQRLQAAFRRPAAPVEQQTGSVPGYIVSSTSRIFWAVGQRRRRCTAGSPQSSGFAEPM
jgi:hypothetical protein